MKIDRAKEDLSTSELYCSTNDPIYNWFFDPGFGYERKLDHFESARYQPVTVDIKHDPYYRSQVPEEEVEKEEEEEEACPPPLHEGMLPPPLPEEVSQTMNSNALHPSLKKRRSKRLARA